MGLPGLSKIKWINAMKLFTKILVHVTDPTADKWMMAKAVEIARRNNATIMIIGVIKEVPDRLESLVQEKFNLDLQRIVRDRQNVQLQKVIVAFEGKEIEISNKTVDGPDFREIIKEVIRGKHDLLLTRKVQEKTLKELLFGTDVVHLIRMCPCPVWVFPDRGKRSFARILVAVDTSTANDEEKKLNHKLLQMATAITQNEDADLHVIHCWEDYGKSISGGSLAEIPVQQVKKYNLESEKRALERFQKFVFSYHSTIPEEHIHFWKDDPGHGIPTLVKSQKIELLILGTLGRSGLEGYLVGNTAERVLNQVNCSILTVKPDGFVSPVSIGED